MKQIRRNGLTRFRPVAIIRAGLSSHIKPLFRESVMFLQSRSSLCKRNSLKRLLLLLVIVGGTFFAVNAQDTRLEIEKGIIQLEEVVSRATRIARGTITASRTEWYGQSIVTIYDVRVEESLVGQAERSLRFLLPGGSLGKVQTIWPGLPRLTSGDEVVLFAEANSSLPALRPINFIHGVVPVRRNVRDGAKVVDARGKAESLEQFLNAIRQILQRR